jgi:hypothetical protein
VGGSVLAILFVGMLFFAVPRWFGAGVLSICPIVAVKSNASYAAKVSGIVIAINAAGALYFWRAQKRKGTLPIIGEHSR